MMSWDPESGEPEVSNCNSIKQKHIFLCLQSILAFLDTTFTFIQKPSTARGPDHTKSGSLKTFYNPRRGSYPTVWPPPMQFSAPAKLISYLSSTQPPHLDSGPLPLLPANSALPAPSLRSTPFLQPSSCTWNLLSLLYLLSSASPVLACRSQLPKQALRSLHFFPSLLHLFF